MYLPQASCVLASSTKMVVQLFLFLSLKNDKLLQRDSSSGSRGGSSDRSNERPTADDSWNSYESSDRAPQRSSSNNQPSRSTERSNGSNGSSNGGYSSSNVSRDINSSAQEASNFALQAAEVSADLMRNQVG